MSDDECGDSVLSEPSKNLLSVKQKSHKLSVKAEEKVDGLDAAGKNAGVSLSNFEAAGDDTDGSDPTDFKTLLNILLCHPEDFEQKNKPSGVRENFMCTLDSNNISIESCKADDNGAYCKTGSSKQLYRVTIGDKGKILSALTCRKDENGILFINKRLGRCYAKQNVGPNDVYELQRTYRYNKANPGFLHILVTAKKHNPLHPLKWYISM